MKRELINKSVLLALVLLISALFLDMIRQFLMPMFMAGIFSAILSPVHRWLTGKIGGRENLASILVIIGIVVLVLAPLSILIGVVVAQAIGVSQSVTPWVQAFINEPSAITAYMEKIPYYNEILPYRAVIIEKAGMVVGNISTFLIDSLSSVTMLTVNAVFSSVIMLYVMFYFLTMGEVLLLKILYFLPLQDRDERRLLGRFTSVTKATLKGTLIIGALQGVICGLAFAFAGIHGAGFLGYGHGGYVDRSRLRHRDRLGASSGDPGAEGRTSRRRNSGSAVRCGGRQSRQFSPTSPGRQRHRDARLVRPLRHPGRNQHVRYSGAHHWTRLSPPCSSPSGRSTVKLSRPTSPMSVPCSAKVLCRNWRRNPLLSPNLRIERWVAWWQRTLRPANSPRRATIQTGNWVELPRYLH